MWAAKIYFMYYYLIWTGFLRPFIGPALKKPEMRWIQSKTFDLSVAIAQMNQAVFFRNIGCEMETMMSCCDYADAAWGPHSLLKLDPEYLLALAGAAPSESVIVNEMVDDQTTRLTTLERGDDEVGESWCDQNSVQTALDLVKRGAIVSEPIDASASSLREALTHSKIPEGHLIRRWSQLVVRVMGTRNYDFGNSVVNAFYSQKMKDWAAAEQTVHWMLAKDGRRIIYPKLNHMQSFAQTAEIMRLANEISESVEHSVSAL
jgi:hypothetical protein